MFRCCVLVAVVLMTLSYTSQALIVPQELPSILSLVYSNIPPIRKGTDSRLGFGFRLGEHADFQVVVELGPQKDTRPIGMNQDDDSSSSKRQVNQNDYKRIVRRPAPTTTTTTTTTRRPATTTLDPNDFAWFRDWFGEWTGTKKKPTNPPNRSRIQSKNSINDITLKKGYVKTAPIVPESALRQLQQLYKMATMDPIVVDDATPNPETFRSQRVNVVASSAESRINILATRQPISSKVTKAEVTDDDELMDVKVE